MAKFQTIEAYVSGAVCGHMWMPDAMAGKPFRAELRGTFGLLGRFTEPATLRDALDLYLSENGGDFQDAAFTADTCLTIIRKRIDGNGQYTVHTKTRDLAELPSVRDMVNSEVFTGDFFED